MGSKIRADRENLDKPDVTMMPAVTAHLVFKDLIAEKKTCRLI